MIDDSIVVMAKEIAARHALDAALVCAIIEQESAGNTWLVRYEPAFYEKYIAPQLAAGQIRPATDMTAETEAICQAMSWGLMQVMGATARENHCTYYGPLPALLDPATGIEMGCREFTALLQNAKGDAELALEDYNGGADATYAQQVLARVAQYKPAVSP